MLRCSRMGRSGHCEPALARVSQHLVCGLRLLLCFLAGANARSAGRVCSAVPPRSIEPLPRMWHLCSLHVSMSACASLCFVRAGGHACVFTCVRTRICTGLLTRTPARFFLMYMSSPDDTATREVDDRAVGTILYTPIRPEFRGPVRGRCVAWLWARICERWRMAGSRRWHVFLPPPRKRIGRISTRFALRPSAARPLCTNALSLGRWRRWHASSTNRSSWSTNSSNCKAAAAAA